MMINGLIAFSLFLGYSIFIVDGSLPQCPADEALLLQPSTQRAGASSALQPDEDPELAAALALSLGQPISKNPTSRRGSTPDAQTMSILAQSARELDDEDQSLKDAIALSMADRDDEDLKTALLLSMESKSIFFKFFNEIFYVLRLLKFL